MSELDHLRAVLLGAIQGITEFLPVSSSAHLAITQRWMGLEADSPQLLLFDVLAHLGTLVAVLIVFAHSGTRFVSRLVRESKGSWQRRRQGWRIALLAAAATVPTALIGLALKDTFESAFDRPRWIGAALIVTGGLLAALKMLHRATRGWRGFRWWQAVLVGIVQACAILPGISRSGSTICVASYCGLRRRWAVEFSFLIAVPAIVGAALVKLKDTLDLSPTQFETIPFGPVVLGSVVSLGTGIVALKILIDAVRRAKLHYFALYCWALGALLISGALDS